MIRIFAVAAVVFAITACSGDGPSVVHAPPGSAAGAARAGDATTGTGTPAATGRDASIANSGSGGMDAGAAAPSSGNDAGIADAASDANPVEAETPEDLVVRNLDISQNTMRRFGAPSLAVNPTNPNNIVAIAQSNVGYTTKCVADAKTNPNSPCKGVTATLNGLPLLTQPRGFFEVKGFSDIGVFVSFDRGNTWTTVDVSQIADPDHPEVSSKGEGPLVVNADGTFYIGFNAINWGTADNFYPNGGVGVMRSTDGGRSWTWTGLTQTPADWPYGDMDRSTGTFYVTSGIDFSTLGARSTGDPSSKEGSIGDRWLGSSQDGAKWTTPQPLGIDVNGSHTSGSHSMASAANGIVGILFSAGLLSCNTFLPEADALGTCLVFQTSTDAGTTWERHPLPVPAGFSPAGITGLMFAADPTQNGHFTAALMNDATTEFLVLHTPDRGKTWTSPVKVTDDASKQHFAPWVAYSPDGVFGLMWRTYEPDPNNPNAQNLPWSVWAVISKDNGATFSKPLKMSLHDSPAAPDDPDDAFSFVGDHGPSGMALDSGHVYIAWSDWTPGERAIYFGAASYKAFEF